MWFFSLARGIGYVALLLCFLPKGIAFFHFSKLGRVIKSQNVVKDIEARHGDHDKTKHNFDFHRYFHRQSQLYANMDEESTLLGTDKSAATDDIHNKSYLGFDSDTMAYFLYKMKENNLEQTKQIFSVDKESKKKATKNSFSIRDAQKFFRLLYPTHIVPHYRAFLTDFLVALFLQLLDEHFQYDAVFAFGVCTQYYTMMQSYEIESEIDVIFQALLTACHLNPHRVVHDASSVLNKVKQIQNISDQDFWETLKTNISPIYSASKQNSESISEFKAIGLMRLMEIWNGKKNAKQTVQKFHSNSDNHYHVLNNSSGAVVSRIVSIWERFVQRQERMRPVVLKKKHTNNRNNKLNNIILIKNSLAFLQRKIYLWSQQQQQLQRQQQHKALSNNMKKKSSINKLQLQ